MIAALLIFDVILSGGRVIDGTGAPWFRADVGIRGDTIAAVGNLSKARARKRIEVHDRVVAPGFFDMLGQSELNALVDPREESKVRQGITTELTGEGISPAPLSVVDEAGDLVEPARRCLERIAKHNMILATGHLGRTEIFALVRGARELGVKKVLVTHAEFPSQSLTGDEQKELADLGAIIEHCFTTTYTNKAPWEDAFANIRKTGVSRTVISTDLGQTINPPVAEGFAMFAQRLLDAGFSAEDVRTMAVTNPTRLIEE